MHLYERRQMPRIAEIIRVFAARQVRAGRGLARDDARLRTAPQASADKREGDAGEIAAAAGAADDDVGIIAGHLELGHRLLANDGLVQQHVIKDAAEGVFRVGVLRGYFDRLADGDPQAPRRIRMFRQVLPPGICFIAGARNALGAPGLHQRLAVGLFCSKLTRTM
jgi:hypothetical protein